MSYTIRSLIYIRNLIILVFHKQKYDILNNEPRKRLVNGLSLESLHQE